MFRVHSVAPALTLVALTAVAALGACHHPPPHHPGEEYLEAIRFEGNKAISSKNLQEGLALMRAEKQGAAPDPYLVTVDGERVKGMYLRHGYLEIDVHSRVERHGDAAVVIYKIEEGPLSTTRVVINGLPDKDKDLSVDDVRKKLPLVDGKPFNYELYDQAKEPLIGVVQDAGYAHASLDSRVIADRANHQAVVELTYDTGPKCHFGSVDVVGVPDELRDAVIARLAIQKGQQFSTSAIAQTQRNLYDMRRFSTVRVLPDKTDGEEVNVKISLAQSAPHEVSVGGGFGMDPATYEVRGRFGYNVTGWPTPLTDFDLDLRPAYAMLRDNTGYEPRIRALGKFTRIDLFRPFMAGEVEGGYNYLVYEAFTSFGPRARLALKSPIFTPRLTAAVGWEFQYLGFRRISPLIDPTLEHDLHLDQTERLGEYTQAVALDLRDNPLETTQGLYTEVRVSEGGPYAAGGLSFLQVTPEARGYLPIFGNVIAARVRAGGIFGDVPPSERYYSGGSTSQRGFSERRLSPTVSGDVMGTFTSIPFGGARLFETNFEVRREVTKIRGMGLGGVAFLDGGDVTESTAQLNLGHLHWAAGLGARLFTLVGAVRLDFGYRLNRTGPTEPEPGSHFAFHLSIGEAY
ncbi:MAG: surface antigen [Myxococcales bacterium]|nr:surface antigen [Myxococcales bacterium]